MSKSQQRLVKHLMSSDVVTLSTKDSIHDALDFLVSNRVSALPVVDNHKNCVGILSTTDLVDFTKDVDEDLHYVDELDPSKRGWLVSKLLHALGEETVGAYMSDDIATVGMEAPVAKAAQLMVRNRVHHLPVVDHDGHLAGILSTMDILVDFADREA
ncbi:MAG: CBS domain-containing protein [Planctomycetaceae bacterium]|nr:CBS domain-containing protein [Planctomycetaceae bacterium]